MLGRPATTRALLACGLAGAVALVGGPAVAKDRAYLGKSPRLWATVNVCDTEEHPDTVGIRGSMPGSGVADEVMFMRFQLQFFDRRDQLWHNIGDAGDSGYVKVGTGRLTQRQSGRNFTVQPPASGSYVMRGTVTFEWRVSGKAVRRFRERTTPEHGATAGADPSGFSAANCEVRP